MGSTGKNPARILIVEDEEAQRLGLASMVQSWGYQPELAANGAEALARLAEQGPIDAIVTDLVMPEVDGYELLRELKSQLAAPPVIVLTAFGNLETAIQTIHELGAFWFLEKPIQPQALRLLLERAVEQSRLLRERLALERALKYQGRLGKLVGRSRPMQEVFYLIEQVAPSSASVLITGESGTGKELAARAIHELSPRRRGPFIAVNCAALPETLIESELFGHEKGAFTGALERRIGCFELANGGTLLLDEIAEMPVATQAKLLRVLEDNHIRRLGGKQEVPIDVRVLAATNREPEKAIREGTLRADLFYRLNVFHIRMPPLRQRKEDIPLLVEALLEEINQKHGTRVAGVEPEVLEKLTEYSWPGNVRELRNVLERSAILTREGMIQLRHLPAELTQAPRQASPPVEAPEDIVTLPVGSTVDEAERLLILKTLEYTGNNKTRAAEILGISLKTLHNKLKLYRQLGLLEDTQEELDTDAK